MRTAFEIAAPLLQLAPVATAKTPVDPIAGLIAALTEPDLFRIVERDGELFVEPAEKDTRVM